MGQEFYKKIYSVREFYIALYKGFRTMPSMIKAKKNKEMSMEFRERIMLAVTEVNGCEVCSYAHTKLALEQGMSKEEIQLLLSGGKDHVPEEEAPALFFAQHYADMRGNPSKESWQQIVHTYGDTKAFGILGAIRAIMIGNVYGIPLSAFRSRLRGKPIQKSNLVYELTMIGSILLFLPIALVHSFLSDLFRVPLI